MKYFKAKIIHLHSQRMETIKAQLRETDITPDEQPALYHIIKLHKRRQHKHIATIMNQHGRCIATTHEIKDVFYNEIQKKFSNVTIDDDSTRLLYEAIAHTVDRETRRFLDMPITTHEIQTATAKTAKRKAPGEDGLTAELYQWGIHIMKDVLTDIYEIFHTGRMPTQMKQGITVCIPKINSPQRVQDYRPLTLLNADYKIYARLIAHRMQQTLYDIVHKNQHSTVPGRNIFDAAAALRDVKAAGATRRNGMYLLALDFNGAFDNISHSYLHGLLQQYGYGDGIRRAITSLYEEARSKIAINGHLTQNIAIQRSVRQGCPLSTIQYALALNPFLILIDKQLQGIRLGQQHTKVTSIAYADDVTVILNDHKYFQTLRS
jgi:hypothetical protein